MDRQAAVVAEVPHLQAETDGPGLEDLGTPVVLHGPPPIEEGVARRTLDVTQNRGDAAKVHSGRDLLVAGRGEHLGQPGSELPDAPADRIPIGDGVDPADPVLALGGVDVAALHVEAMESKERHGFPAGLPLDHEDHPLVRMAVNVGVPLLVPDDEGDLAGFESRSVSPHGGRTSRNDGRALE